MPILDINDFTVIEAYETWRHYHSEFRLMRLNTNNLIKLIMSIIRIYRSILFAVSLKALACVSGMLKNCRRMEVVYGFMDAMPKMTFQLIPWCANYLKAKKHLA